MAAQGARGVKCIIWDGSLLDPEDGIRIRNMNIGELCDRLPKLPNTETPTLESLIWLLFTGEIPTIEQTHSVLKLLNEKATLPQDVINLIDSLPNDLSPMAQLSMAILSLSKYSNFAKEYDNGVQKSKYWESIFDDAIDIIAKIPIIAAKIYRNVYKDGKLGQTDKKLDLSANLCKALGFDDPLMFEMMRMYFIIHSDHEGGNVSSHVGHTVSSALSDPYTTISTSINGLAGRLHGFANREVISWMLKLNKDLDGDVSEEKVSDYITNCVKNNKLVPGYGHAVLRKTDPRFICQHEFSVKHNLDSPMIKLVHLLYKIVPPILKNVQKIKNPWPNLDGHSGALLTHFGLVEHDFYTVLFGASRTVGVLNQAIWARALELPLERPKSLTIKCIEDLP